MKDPQILVDEILVDELIRTNLDDFLARRMRAQIAVYTGKSYGGLADLQDWYYRSHLERNPTVCAECQQVIETIGHHPGCPIVKNYLALFPASGKLWVKPGIEGNEDG